MGWDLPKLCGRSPPRIAQTRGNIQPRGYLHHSKPCNTQRIDGKNCPLYGVREFIDPVGEEKPPKKGIPTQNWETPGRTHPAGSSKVDTDLKWQMKVDNPWPQLVAGWVTSLGR